MKLISMTEFVLEQAGKTHLNMSFEDMTLKNLRILKNYANLLKQHLELGMFVPCDEEGNVLEEPEMYNHYLSYGDFGFYEAKSDLASCKKFKQAKERVLFEGDYIYHDIQPSRDWNYSTFNGIKIFRDAHQEGKYVKDGKVRFMIIEDLTKQDLTLTQTALKQIGI